MPHSVLDILSQEPRAIADRPYTADWIVHNIHLTDDGARIGSRARYPVRVDVTISTGERTSWDIPLPLCWRYDFSAASYDTCRVWRTTQKASGNI